MDVAKLFLNFLDAVNMKSYSTAEIVKLLYAPMKKELRILGKVLKRMKQAENLGKLDDENKLSCSITMAITAVGTIRDGRHSLSRRLTKEIEKSNRYSKEYLAAKKAKYDAAKRLAQAMEKAADAANHPPVKKKSSTKKKTTPTSE